MYDYDPENDTLVIQRNDREKGYVAETFRNYLATLPENEFVSVSDRKKVGEMIMRAVKEPGQTVFEYRGRRLSKEFSPCKAKLASIFDENGKVYRVVGQIRMLDEGNDRAALNEKLKEITGTEYNDVNYQYSMAEQVLSILENAADTDSAVQEVITAVGKKLGVSRAYVIEDLGDGDHCSNTFEWCNDGVTPEIENLRNFTYPEGARDEYIRLFNEGSGVIVCEKIETLPDWLENTFRQQNIKSVIQCAITENGNFCGFVGFDACDSERKWTNQQKQTLMIVSQVIGSFLFTNRHKDQLALSGEAVKLMNNSPAVFYIIDPDTYELLFANDTIIKRYGKFAEGLKCYDVFNCGRSENSNCPVKTFEKTGMSIPSGLTLGNGERCVMQASPFIWQGRKAIAVSGMSVSDFERESLENAEEKYNEEVKRYQETLLPLYDEITELDYGREKFLMLRTEDRSCSIPKKGCSLDEALEKWTGKILSEKDRAAVKEFFEIKNIKKAFALGKAPSINYAFAMKDGSERVCCSTLLRIDSTRYLCCNKDITEQLRGEKLREDVLKHEAKAEERDKLRIVIEQTGAAVVEMNFETGSFTSSEAYRKYEASRCDQNLIFFGKGGTKTVHREDIKKFHKFFEVGQLGENSAETEVRLLMIDGSYRWTRISGTYIRDEEGKVTGATGILVDIDDEMKSKLALQEMSERTQGIVENISTGIIIYEMGKKILPIFVNDRACEMLGYVREEVDLRIANGETIDFMPNMEAALREYFGDPKKRRKVEVPRVYSQRKDKSRFWLRASCSVKKLNSGKLYCYAVLTDITEEILKEQIYKNQTEKLRIMMESSGLITFDYSPVEDTMHLALIRSGKGLSEETRKDFLKTLDSFENILPEEKNAFAEKLRLVSSLPLSGTFDFHTDYFGTGMRCFRAKYISLADESGRILSVFGRLEDIDDIMREQDMLRARAQTDDVSGINNKNYAIGAITKALETKKEDSVDAVLFIDIDDFKKLNDTIGHMEADKVLHAIGGILRRIFRSDDIVARFGGDEFIVYMRSVSSKGTVLAKAESLIEEFSKINTSEGVTVTCSVGAAIINGAGVRYEDAMRTADRALYKIKGSGKKQVAIDEIKRKTELPEGEK